MNKLLLLLLSLCTISCAEIPEDLWLEVFEMRDFCSVQMRRCRGDLLFSVDKQLVMREQWILRSQQLIIEDACKIYRITDDEAVDMWEFLNETSANYLRKK